MAIKYRNIRNGKIVTVPEPKEVEAAARSPYAGQKAAVHQRRTIQRMDDSRRWERAASEPINVPKPEPEPAAKPESEQADGVHNVGGGWHEIVIDGEVVEKVRGAEAAQEIYEGRA